MSDKPAWQYRRRDEGTLHGPYDGEKIVAWFGQPQDAEKAANLEVRIEHQSRSKSNAVEPLVSCSADTAALIASRSYAYITSEGFRARMFARSARIGFESRFDPR